jgi:hypothetical protein
MDPEITWQEFALARAEERWDDCAEHAGDLAEWIEKGGYVPETCRTLNPDLNPREVASLLRGYAR